MRITEHLKKRYYRDERTENHFVILKVTTWWLLGIIPVFQRNVIISQSLYRT